MKEALEKKKLMRARVVNALHALMVFIFVIGGTATAAQQETAPAPASGWLERDTLTGDWGGGRTWLKEQGITLKPRFSQFCQGLAGGTGKHSFQYGDKADLWLNTDLSKFGFWEGFSVTGHAEYNFGRSVNGSGGAMVPVNTALDFPGMEGRDAFDFSSVYVGQKFGDSVSLIAGKINIIDIAASKPFMGGAGINSFWNITFAAPPSGTVPPYLFGALLDVRTEPANFGLWIYDPDDVVNRSGFERGFSNGVTVRGTVEFPISIAERGGHQGFVATYSTKDGYDLRDLDDLFLPTFDPTTVRTKTYRYYFAYTFDQYLYQSKENPKEGCGLFGQFGISDGNPNRLYWSLFAGVGGTGLIPGRSRDNWGAGYYYDTLSGYVTNALAPVVPLGREQGVDIFYNFSVTPWLTVGGDFQVIDPTTKTADTAYFCGLRAVIKV